MAENDKNMTATESALTGAGIGAAGVGGSVGLIGVTTAIVLAPVSILVGLLGGLAWWAASDKK